MLDPTTSKTLALGTSSALVGFYFAVGVAIAAVALLPGASASCDINIGDCGSGGGAGSCTVNLASSPGFCRNGGECTVNFGICDGSGASCTVVVGGQCSGDCPVVIGARCTSGSNCQVLVSADLSGGSNPGGCSGGSCGVVLGQNGNYCGSGCNSLLLLRSSC